MTVGIYVNFTKDINASNTKNFIGMLKDNNIEYFVCDEACDYIKENLLPLKSIKLCIFMMLQKNLSLKK